MHPRLGDSEQPDSSDPLLREEAVSIHVSSPVFSKPSSSIQKLEDPAQDLEQRGDSDPLYKEEAGLTHASSPVILEPSSLIPHVQESTQDSEQRGDSDPTSLKVDPGHPTLLKKNGQDLVVGLTQASEQHASSDPTGLLGADGLHTQAKSGDMFQDTQAVSKDSG